MGNRQGKVERPQGQGARAVRQADGRRSGRDRRPPRPARGATAGAVRVREGGGRTATRRRRPSPEVELAVEAGEAIVDDSTERLPTDLRELYYVGELIGRGGMAEVYEAIDLRTGEELAVKRLAPTLAGREHQKLRFANEIDLLDRCRGPFVLELVASGTWEGIPAYVCERCTTSLYDLAR